MLASLSLLENTRSKGCGALSFQKKERKDDVTQQYTPNKVKNGNLSFQDIIYLIMKQIKGVSVSINLFYKYMTLANASF